MPQVTIRAESCKSCGYCVKFCPKGVLAVGHEVNSKGYPFVVAAHPENCIGCASCSYICPSRLDLAHNIVQAKLRLSPDPE